MRILNITNCIPYPALTGAPLRTYNLLARFARKHEVFLAAFAGNKEQEQGVKHMLGFCKDIVAPRPGRPAQAGRLLKASGCFLRGMPPELALLHSAEMTGNISKLVTAVDFDAVVIEHGIMGEYLEVLPPALQKKTAWMLHDIDYDKFKRISRTESRVIRKFRLGLHSCMMRRWMPRFAGRFGVCVTVSEADRKLLLAANSRLKVEVSPNGVDTRLYQPLPEAQSSSTLLFAGNMSYGPNIDAVSHFCREVLPLVRSQVPDVELWIVGTDPTPQVQGLEGNGVHVTGRVAEMAPYYAKCTACVVPLRAGSGTRLKILEAMALGRPVVSTTIGAEGLEVRDGEHLLIGDSPQRFAEQTVEMLRNQSLRRRITENARQLAVTTYDWDIIAERFINILSGIGK
jgi:polysaccharide biosynthesis protein PslH